MTHAHGHALARCVNYQANHRNIVLRSSHEHCAPPRLVSSRPGRRCSTIRKSRRRSPSRFRHQRRRHQRRRRGAAVFCSVGAPVLTHLLCAYIPITYGPARVEIRRAGGMESDRQQLHMMQTAEADGAWGCGLDGYGMWMGCGWGYLPATRVGKPRGLDKRWGWRMEMCSVRRAVDVHRYSG
ncbi:hypothetical protein BZA05DRAFT_86892 [Tricharina praecox]|uniref:uncharacterized protein n=1 Tax=Tricharina praecox TaxID=43433 RepID=UPI00221FF537|nr:uncharacterized protein BZA05DRAFT_86892 [Tricharina praecox]KAI5849251.1 hypothetical protein BZA05DRAFT_86892 [Tricharina praecox]